MSHLDPIDERLDADLHDPVVVEPRHRWLAVVSGVNALAALDPRLACRSAPARYQPLGRWVRCDPRRVDRRPAVVPTSVLVVPPHLPGHRWMAGRVGPARSAPDRRLAVRHVLFDVGRDPSHLEVLRPLLAAHGLGLPSPADFDTVMADHAEGVSRGVRGSPHFFVDEADFFCPALDIGRDSSGYHIAVDVAGFDRFAGAVFG